MILITCRAIDTKRSMANPHLTPEAHNKNLALFKEKQHI